MRDELIDQLAATPKALAHLVAEIPEERLAEAPPGEWSPRTVLAHFRDDEYLCARPAIERLLAEHDPTLAWVDGAEWVATRNTTRDRREWLLADFALQRQATLGILRALREEDWQRAGRQGGARVTVESIVAGMVRHDREHIAQLERITGETLANVLDRRSRMAE